MNTANIAVTSGTYSIAIMHILWNFQQNLKVSSWKISESFFKTKWPHYPANNYIYYIKHESPE